MKTDNDLAIESLVKWGGVEVVLNSFRDPKDAIETAYVQCFNAGRRAERKKNRKSDTPTKRRKISADDKQWLELAQKG